MDNASVLSDKIGMGLNQRITGSRYTTEKYTNTLVVCNQPWVELPENPKFGKPVIKAKGGEAVWLNSSLVFLFGNQKNGGITRISITKSGRKVKIATRTKVSVLKNHINGLGYEDGKIMITTQDFMKCRSAEEEKKSREDYVKTYGSYISEILGVNISGIDDVEVIEEEVED